MPNTTYIVKMKSHGDELVVVGRPLSDPNIVDYILKGLIATTTP